MDKERLKTILFYVVIIGITIAGSWCMFWWLPSQAGALR